MECTLYQDKHRESKISSGLQTIYLKNWAHWVLASNMSYCEKAELNLYDSDFSSGDKEFLNILNWFFDFTKNKFVKVQKQSGGFDCGLFIIAAACALLYGQNPAKCNFSQEKWEII